MQVVRRESNATHCFMPTSGVFNLLDRDSRDPILRGIFSEECEIEKVIPLHSSYQALL